MADSPVKPAMANFYGLVQHTPREQHLDDSSPTVFPSRDDWSCIDPRQLNPAHDHDTIALGTPGAKLGMCDPYSDETTAGRGELQYLAPDRRETSSVPDQIDFTSSRSLGDIQHHAANACYPLATSPSDFISLCEDQPSQASRHNLGKANSPTTPTTTKRSTRHKSTLVFCCATNCNETFFRKDHLTQHIRNKHLPFGNFRCPVQNCSHQPSTLGVLFQHMCNVVNHREDPHFGPVKNAFHNGKCAGCGLVKSCKCTGRIMTSLTPSV